MKLEELVSKINLKTKDKPIVYITADLERALGLEKLLDNYHIIYSNPVDYSNYIKNANLIHVNEPGIDASSSQKILNTTSAKNLLSKFSAVFIQTFKISSAFEKKLEGTNYTPLNSTAALNRLIEDKISQHTILTEAGLSYKKTIVSELDKVTHEDMVNELGTKFVLQFGRGHTGSGTMIIETKEKFEEIQTKFPGRNVKMSEFIETEYIYNVNCCLTEKYTLFAGLNFQITGVKTLTSGGGTTVGNDFHQRKGIEGMEQYLLSEFKKIANVVRSHGFRGLCGIDFVVKDGKFYLIEINARQTASIPFHTKIQLKNNQIPMSLFHLAHFMDIDFEIDEESYNIENLKPVNASQVFQRSKSENFEIKSQIKSGVYRLQSDNSARAEEAKGNENIIYLDEEKDRPLIFQREAYNIDDLSEEMLILASTRGQLLGTHDEIARIQLLNGATDSDLKLFSYIEEPLIAIENIVK